MIPSHPNLRVRPATLTDLACLVSFNAALAWETEGRHLDTTTLQAGTQALFDDPQRGFYLVAERHVPTPTVVGQLMITYEWSDWRNGTFWWIQSVYVHPDWRRQHVFRQLYDHVFEMTQDKPHIAGIRLYVEQANKTAQLVYTHLGFTQAQYHIFEHDGMRPSRIL
ncbi:MAG: GNAT family N-acetyltransferase [Nitrospirales bacterium]|nr:GNAT family N-acetyltransferase [Nitrospirales bacterium]